VSKNLSDHNRFGGEFNIELYFKHHPDTLFGRTDLKWIIGIKDINQVHSSFTRDLFEVYFRGNKNYAGTTAELAPFNYRLLKYQQLQFGLSKSINKDSIRIEMGAAIGLNIGQQLIDIHSTRADLYTEDIGEYLDVNANIEIHRSDSAKTAFGSFNGAGSSVDLFFNETIKKKHFFFARISNLGFIQWNRNSTELTTDSSFRFEGVDVSKLFDFTDTIKSKVTLDSTVTQPFLSRRKYSSYTSFLPAKIEFTYLRTVGHRNMKIGAGANYMLSADYLPLVHLDWYYPFKNNLLVVNVSYGGYTTFGTGLYFRHHFRDGTVISLGSNYMNALFHLDTSTSEDVRISIYRKF
jgi:hypothetical protein